MTNREFVDFLGPVAARHELACDRYQANPSRENEAIVRLYGAELCLASFHGDFYSIYVDALLQALGGKSCPK